MDDVNAFAQRHVERIRTAIESVKPEARGLPYEEARERLARALTEHGVVMPDKQVDLVARGLSDPWWAAKHPIRAWCEARRQEVVDPEELHRQVAHQEEARRKEERLWGPPQPDGSWKVPLRWKLRHPILWWKMRHGGIGIAG